MNIYKQMYYNIYIKLNKSEVVLNLFIVFYTQNNWRM